MRFKNFNLISLPLITVLCLLCFISCLAICSATPLINYPSPETYWIKQVVFYLLSFGLMFFLYAFKNDRIYSAAWIIYGVLMVFLVGLVIERICITRFGFSLIPLAKTTNNSTSWYTLRIGGRSLFDFQPSEFMKIAMIIVLSKTIQDHNDKFLVHSLHSDLIMLVKVLAIALPPCLLIYMQNDAGVTLILLVSLVFILFVSGLQRKWFMIGIFVFVVIIVFMSYLYIFNHDLFVSIIGAGRKVNRFYGWLDPEGTYSNEGYQLFNALMAYGTGGLFGHGFQSVVIAYPEPQTDFIFAVIAQGSGFVGAFITILVICAFDIVLLMIAMRTKNDRDKYFIAGIFGLLIFQQIWNIGMVLGLVPITGITLPFLSYGGSSLLSYMIAMGMILDIERQTRIVERKNRYD